MPTISLSPKSHNSESDEYSAEWLTALELADEQPPPITINAVLRITHNAYLKTFTRGRAPMWQIIVTHDGTPPANWPTSVSFRRTQSQFTVRAHTQGRALGHITSRLEKMYAQPVNLNIIQQTLQVNETRPADRRITGPAATSGPMPRPRMTYRRLGA